LGLALKDDSEVKVVNDQFGQPTSCLDLAQSIIEISESSAEPGIYNRTNNGNTSWYGFAKLIFEIAGKETERVIPVSSEEFPSRVIRPKYSVLDPIPNGHLHFIISKSMLSGHVNSLNLQRWNAHEQVFQRIKQWM
jgi:dTDP-4-dehydrorhamnose reductase